METIINDLVSLVSHYKYFNSFIASIVFTGVRLQKSDSDV